VRRPTPPHILALMAKVKRQLADLKRPAVKRFKKAVRDKRRQIFPTVADYQKMDPYYLSTMTGAFAGRKVSKSTCTFTS